MKFLNLKKYTIDTEFQFKEQEIILDGLKIFSYSIKEWKENLTEVFKKHIQNEENLPLFFNVLVNNSPEKIDDKIHLSRLIYDLILNLNYKNTSTTRTEHRLGVPKQIQFVNCSTIPLMKNVNNDIWKDQLAIKIVYDDEFIFSLIINKDEKEILN